VCVSVCECVRACVCAACVCAYVCVYVRLLDLSFFHEYVPNSIIVGYLKTDMSMYTVINTG